MKRRKRNVSPSLTGWGSRGSTSHLPLTRCPWYRGQPHWGALHPRPPAKDLRTQALNRPPNRGRSTFFFNGKSCLLDGKACLLNRQAFRINGQACFLTGKTFWFNRKAFPQIQNAISEVEIMRPDHREESSWPPEETQSPAESFPPSGRVFRASGRPFPTSGESSGSSGGVLLASGGALRTLGKVSPRSGGICKGGGVVARTSGGYVTVITIGSPKSA